MEKQDIARGKIAKGDRRASSFIREQKRIRDVLDADLLRSKNDSDDVELEGVARPLESRDPDFCRAAEFALLASADRAHGAAEAVRRAGLHLDECDFPAAALVRSGASRNQIYVAVTAPEAALRDLPSVDG